MRSRAGRSTASLLIACLFLLAAPGALLAQQSRIAGAIEDARRAILPGSVSPKAESRYDRGRVDPSFPIPFVTLTIKPSPAQQAALERLLDEQRDPASANYRRWLTPEQFGERFGLAPGDYAAVVWWLQSHHLHLEKTARARNWISFSGSAGDVGTAFQTEIHRYVVDGEPHFANAREVSVPAALAEITGGIRGLDDFSRLPASEPPLYTTSVGTNELAPDDWATIYDVAPVYAMGIDGSGQRVGIIGRSDIPQSYIDIFRSQFGLAPSTVEQHPIGPDPGVTNAAGEAALDLEWSGAIARGATIVYIYSSNFMDSAQAAIDENLAPVLSQSFGTCEPEAGIGNRLMAQQANAQGITWVASAGDSGAAGCDPHGTFGTTGNATTVSDGPAVNIPASFPEVTAVGGTEFNEGSGQYWNRSNSAADASAMSYIPEMVWNETGGGGLLASGGGASMFFSKPAWQNAPGVPADNARDVPDVSFSASGNHDPYMVVNLNGQRATGGTSAGAPSFAGVLALLNQYLVSRGVQAQPGLGNINPELYTLARTANNVFHDITQGNNMVPCTAGSPGCVNGQLGFSAGPGYDLATGLGSIDVYNLVTQWSEPTPALVGTSTSLAANPSAITLGGSVQLTATVTPAAASSTVPTGSVVFNTGLTTLGVAPVVNVGGAAMATLTATGPNLPVGSTTVTAVYLGDSNFNGSKGSAVVSVAAGSPGSFVMVNITPNPAHEGQVVQVTLTEEAGVPTTITGWTINGADYSSVLAQDFGGTALAAYGTMLATFTTAFPAVIPASRVYVFTGVDANGRTWSQQYTLVLDGPLGMPGITLAGVPANVQQNPAAPAACQWSQQLFVQENLGFPVELTRFLAGAADWTSRIQALFGTTHLAPFGMLQANVCWPGGSPPAATTFEIDGTDSSGVPVSGTFAATYSGPVANPGMLSATQNSVALSVPSGFAAETLGVSLSVGGSWTAMVLPSNQTTAWLTSSAITSTSANQVMLLASAAGLAPGVYNAALLIQAQDAVPQFIEVPVVLTVGNSGTTIGGVTNGASFQQAFAPGMILSVFGSQLAPSTQIATSLPLPATMAGVSATVNGVSAPLYYVSPTQLNLQIPYTTGSGPAVLGVNNNGQFASFVFPVTASAPGIFTDLSQTLVPYATGKHGDTLLAFITGEGEVWPPLATGATPFIETPVGVLPQPLLPVTVTVGGVPAPIAFAGIPWGLAGVTQIDFVIPASAPLGTQPLVVTVGGVASPAASITVSQ